MPSRRSSAMGQCAAAGSPCGASVVAVPGGPAATTRCPKPMDTQRLILLFIFGFSVLMLWEAWDREHRPKPPPVPVSQPAVPVPGKAPAKGSAAPPGPIAAAAPAELRGEIIRVTSDLVSAEIDTLGGTLKRLELLRHKDSNDPEKNFILISPAHQYEAQSGLAGGRGPNHRSLWQARPGGLAHSRRAPADVPLLPAPSTERLLILEVLYLMRQHHLLQG